MKKICRLLLLGTCANLFALTASSLLAQEPAPVAAPAQASAEEASQDAKLALDARPVADASIPEPSVAPSPDESSPTAENLKSIGGLIVSGGSLNVLFFGVLGLFSLWAATVVLERLVNLRQEKILPSGFVKKIQAMVPSSKAMVEPLQAACEGTPSPATRVLRAGVIRAGRPMSEVEKAMEDAVTREMALLRSSYKPLNVVGNISPLVGLLGTVVGMIMAFQVSSQSGLGKAEQLAEGIYLALMTTAAGLSLAIPCLLFASWFQSRGERYMGKLCDVIMETLPHFARLESQFTSTSNRIAPLVQADSQLSRPSAERDVDVDQEPIDSNGLSVRERFLRDGVFDPVKG